jgi:hypothetical protein
VTINEDRLITVDINRTPGIVQSQPEVGIVEVHAFVQSYDPEEFIADVNSVAEKHDIPVGFFEHGYNPTYIRGEYTARFPLETFVPDMTRYMRIRAASMHFGYYSLSSQNLTVDLSLTAHGDEPGLQDALSLLARAGATEQPADVSRLSEFILGLPPSSGQ